MPGLSSGEIVQMTLVGRLAGQRVLNIFHYQTVTPSTEQNEFEVLKKMAEQFDTGTDNPTLALLACQTQIYTLESIRAQRIYPTRSIYIDAPSGLPGTFPADASSPNWAAAITRRGPVAGRKYVSTLHVVGVPASANNAGLLTDAYRALLATVVTRLQSVWSLTGDAWEGRPVIFNKSNPGGSLGIQTASIKPEMRVQRRRTVGLGE